uniref:Ankyrin-3 n=1 Tax=Magallana gigas TaxID=29159 RepID=A0A8W8NLL4_MAGGI
MLMQKAITNEVPCKTCFQKHKKIEWERNHPPAKVERQITTAKSVAYKNPLPKTDKVPTQLEINLMKREKRLEKLMPKPTGPKRDASAQYYGHYLDPNEVFKFKASEESIRF